MAITVQIWMAVDKLIRKCNRNKEFIYIKFIQEIFMLILYRVPESMELHFIYR